MSSPRDLMHQHELEPKKSLGQNFLHDPNTLQKIVDAANVQPTDTVIEIGPGTGSMTELLVVQAGRVIAIEVDERLKPILESQFGDRVTFHWVDILEADIAHIINGGAYKVVANLPYYITSAILRKLLEGQPKPRSITVTVQKEVAERITEKPGNMSILSVSTQFYGEPQLASIIKAGAFWPRPDVDSAVLHIDVYEQSPYDVADESLFFEVVRAGFSQKRKQLKNSLAGGLGLSGGETTALLEGADIDPRRRAETLSIMEWAALSQQYQQSR
jgi:16S rRNA (adenine1518-N6/adenine1519-N6)-dimethyltransferase